MSEASLAGQSGAAPSTAAEETRMGHFVPADFPLAVRILAAISRMFAFLEGIGIGGCLLLLIGLATWQFTGRNLRAHGLVWIPPPPDWIDGLLRHSVFLLGFLGAAYATFTGRHIRIDAITRIAPPRRRMILRVITTTAAVIICYFLVKSSYQFFKVCQEEAGEMSQDGQVFTSSRGAIAMICGYSLVGFHFVVQLTLDLVWLISRRTPPAVWISEASHGEAPDPSFTQHGDEAPALTPGGEA